MLCLSSLDQRPPLSLPPLLFGFLLLRATFVTFLAPSSSSSFVVTATASTTVTLLPCSPSLFCLSAAPPPPLSSPTTAPTVDLLLCPQEKLPSSSSSAAPLLASVDGTSVAVAISFDPRGSLLPNFAASLFCPSFLLLLRRDPVAAAEAVASILRRRPHLPPLPLLPPLFPPSPSFAATAVTLLFAAGFIFSLSFSINCLPPPVFFLLPSPSQ